MAEPETFDPPFKLLGGWMCFDFVNTVNWDRPGDRERFHSYVDLIRWNHYVGNFSDEEARLLRHEAERRPEEAAAIFDKVIVLRAVIHRIFAAIARDQPPEAADLAELNTALAETLARSGLEPAGDRFRWVWAGDRHALEGVFWPVAWSVAELLTSDQLERVGQCDGESCGWLFFDTSRNRSRRWCDMQHCGNLAKAKRHYRRHKAGD